MAAKCPLCFKKLDATQQLVRFCISHPESTAISCKGDWRSRILCSRNREESTKPIQLGVFLRHIGCAAINPFFAGGQVSVPQQGSLNVNGTQIKIDHWMFGALGTLAKSNLSVREMWFPLAMFQAVNRQFLDLSVSNAGIAMRFAGAQDSGKTILATMAMLPSGYSTTDGSGIQPGERVENYCYAAPYSAVDPSADFLQSVLPLSSMRSGQNVPKWTVGTKPTSVNAKAAFFRTPGGIIMQNPWRALVMYDTAGEINEFPAEHHQDMVDVGAVVLDVSRLRRFGGNPQPAVTTVKERLESARARRKCLIVSKLDLVESRLNGGQVMTEIRNGRRPNPGLERALLREWLTTVGASDTEQTLAKMIADTEVFLVWTEGLTAAAVGDMPKSYGLGNFVHWALNTNQQIAKQGK